MSTFLRRNTKGSIVLLIIGVVAALAIVASMKAFAGVHNTQSVAVFNPVTESCLAVVQGAEVERCVAGRKYYNIKYTGFEILTHEQLVLSFRQSD